MLKVAIVGNIASGKSTIEKIIESYGYKVYDTDKIAHSILENNTNIKKIFGTTNRNDIAQIVFSDPDKLKILEEIIHPLVKEELLKIFNKEFNVVFISVPQLFEAGFETLFDKIIYITANEEIRKERLIKRNSFTQEEARKRINAQMENNKKEKSDFVIENNESLQVLEIKVAKILQTLISI